MYNYNEVIKADVMDYIRYNYSPAELAEKLTDRDEFAEELNDELWICDSVTGNASGSYFFNAYKAEEAIAHNWELLRDALSEFGYADIDPLEKGAEWCDVTIRCYMLNWAIYEAIDDLADELAA